MSGIQVQDQAAAREDAQERIREYARLQPALGVALRGDAAVYAMHRGERTQFHSRGAEWRNVARLLWSSLDYCGLALYRTRVALRRRGVPVVPTLLGKICALMFGIRIGRHVLVESGVYINHGNVVIDGISRIGRGTVITAWVTIGSNDSSDIGPVIGRHVFISPKASILGRISVGEGAQIGPNCIVVSDVPPHAVVAAPRARRVGTREGTASGA